MGIVFRGFHLRYLKVTKTEECGNFIVYSICFLIWQLAITVQSGYAGMVHTAL